jgi:hypothetical protein
MKIMKAGKHIAAEVTIPGARTLNELAAAAPLLVEWA